MKKSLCYILLITFILTFTGCWGMRDVSNKAFVTAIGIDSVNADTEPPDNKPHIIMDGGSPVASKGSTFPASTKGSQEKGDVPPQYRVSVEIVKPVLLRSEARNKSAAIVITSSGGSLQEALQELQTGVSREISLSHLRVLIIGEQMAKQNFKDTFSYFEKHPEIARRLRISFVQNGTAMDILKTQPVFEKYVADELIHFSQIDEKLPTARKNPFATLLNDMLTTNGRGLAARLTTADNGQLINRSGSAVFHKWKLAGWLSEKETKKANWLVGHTDSAVVSNTGKGIYTYWVDKFTTSIKPVIEQKKLKKFKVSVRTGGIILEERGKYIHLEETDELESLEETFAQTISEEIKSALHKAQKDIKVDYLGFGTKLRAKDPDLYNKIDWDKTFQDIPIEVSVDCDISMLALSK